MSSIEPKENEVENEIETVNYYLYGCIWIYFVFILFCLLTAFGFISSKYFTNLRHLVEKFFFWIIIPTVLITIGSMISEYFSSSKDRKQELSVVFLSALCSLILLAIFAVIRANIKRWF